MGFVSLDVAPLAIKSDQQRHLVAKRPNCVQFEQDNSNAKTNTTTDLRITIDTKRYCTVNA